MLARSWFEPRVGSDRLWEGANPVEGTMNQQAKSAINALRQSVERLQQAKSDPTQLQQAIQQIQDQVQKLEQQLKEDR